MKKIISLLLAAVTAVLVIGQAGVYAAETPPDISVSFDGFETEYNSFDSRKTFGGTEETFLKGKDYSFVTSKTAVSGKGAGAYVIDNTMYMYGGNAGAAVVGKVNLLPDKKFNGFTRIKADAGTGSPRNGGNRHVRPYIDVMVNEKENTYYRFAIGSTNANWDKPTDSIATSTPVLMKVTDGKSTVIESGGYSNFGYVYEIAHWDIAIDAENNKISWSVTVEPLKDDTQYTATVWSSSYEDAAIAGMMADTKYPAAFGATMNDAKFRDIKLWIDYDEEYIAPDFEDSFDGSAKISYGSGESAVLSEKDGYKWKLSAVNQGDISQSSYAALDGGRLIVGPGNRNVTTMVNLDHGDRKVNSVSRITADVGGMSANSRFRPYIGLFMSADEKSYYQLGIGAEDSWEKENPRKWYGRTPYISKITDNARDKTVADLGSEGVLSGPSGYPVDSSTFTYEEGKFGYTYSKAHWDITVDRENNKISWTVTVTPVSSSYAPATWSGSITDPALAAMIDNSKYAVTLGSTVNASWFDDVKVWYNFDKDYVPADFWEDFESYTAENCISEKTNFTELDNPCVIAEHPSGAKWVTSDVNDGLYVSDGKVTGYSAARIDVIGKRMGINGTGSRHLANVNLDMGDVRMDCINKVSFETYSGTRFQGVSMFISGDESNFIMIGQRGDQEMTGFSENEGDTKYWYAPVVAKYADGVFTLIDFDNSLNWTSGDKSVKWEVSVDGNTISYKATSRRGVSWQGSYTDTDNIISSNWRYPLAVSGIGNHGEGYVGNIKLWYQPETPWEYEKKAYTFDEFEALIKEAKYSAKPEDMFKLMSLDLSDVKGEKGSANVTVDVNEQSDICGKLLGMQIGFGDNEKYVYSSFFDENGELKSEFVSLANSMPKIPSFRLGGTLANDINMLNTVGDVNSRQPSVYVSLPSGSGKNIGDTASNPIKMGLREWLKVIKKINRNATVIPCISPLTTTPEDTKKIIEYISGDQSTVYGAMRIADGISEPSVIEYIEIANESDMAGSEAEMNAKAQWYTEQAQKQIDAVKQAYPQMKIMICGPTAPWSNQYWKRAWAEPVASALAAKADAVSFHPYYNGITSEDMVNYYVKNVINVFRKYNPDIKTVFTEHGVNWSRERDASYTMNFQSAMYVSKFIEQIADEPHVDGAYFHNIIGSLWGFITYGLNETPNMKLYKLLGQYLNGKLLSHDVVITGGTSDWNVGGSKNFAGQLTVIPVKMPSGRIAVFMSNLSPYNDIDITLDGIGQAYKPVKKTVMTAPNAFVNTYDEATANLVTVNEESMEGAAFDGIITLPAKTALCVEFESESTSAALEESFNAEVGAVTAKPGSEETVLQSGNGTLWKLSGTKLGNTKIGIKTHYGTAAVGADGLVLSNKSAVNELGVNWDVSGAGIPGDIKKVEFTLTDSDASQIGVRLFAGVNETSDYDFSGNLSGFTGSGSTKWTIEINSGKIFWTAQRDGAANAGTMEFSAPEYTYLMSVYSLGAGSASIDDIKVYCGAQTQKAFTVTDGSKISVCVIPSMINSDTMHAVVAAYSGSRLTGIQDKAVDVSAAKDILDFEKDSGADNFKVFLWESLSSMKNLDSTVTIGNK